MIFLGDDENQASDAPKASECVSCTEGLIEYIQDDFCKDANGEDLCRIDAKQLASKLIDGEINEQQFADGTVELIDRYFGKAIVGDKDVQVEGNRGASVPIHRPPVGGERKQD